MSTDNSLDEINLTVPLDTALRSSMSEYQRGVAEGIQALENYFRDEDSNLMLAEARENSSHVRGWDWHRLTEADFDALRKGAISDAQYQKGASA